MKYSKIDNNMANNSTKEKYFGILASVDWNSNKWQEVSTEEDLDKSNFGHVVEHGITYTSLNFGHEKYPIDENGYYSGLLPQLWTKTPDGEKSKLVDVVFIKSKNWEDSQTYIVGFYAFPIFKKGKKSSPIDSFTGDFEVNIKSLPKNIHLLDDKGYINLNTHSALKKFLPEGKKLGKQGYNYLTKENVYKILDEMTKLNLNDQKLHGIKRWLLTSIDKK
jgi:hypothetical protein